MNWTKKGLALGQGVVCTMAVMAVLSLAAAAVIYFSSLPESCAPGVAVVINAIALVAGGYAAGRKAGEKGLLMGVLLAAVMLLLMLAGGDGMGERPAIKAVYCLLAAMSGSIFGVK